MKIASIQPKIADEFSDTVSGQFQLMEAVAKDGADIILLPELATTGFTGRIAKVERSLVVAHIDETTDRLREWSKSTGIVISFGSAVFPKDESLKPLNSMLTVFPDGTTFIDDKIHAKEGNEEKFFAKGKRRQGFQYRDVKFDFVICREFRNYHEAVALISEETDIVFWPGCIRHNTGEDSIDNLTEENICGFAKKNGIYVVGSNWANFLDRNSNRPGNMGGSYIATPKGGISHRCKWDEEDYLIMQYNQKPTSVRNRSAM
ncbi:hydrolase, carbon-nitrogen family [Verrucomicrobiia bacterium DG1235]|nr:hydrolase, carbon-nitrogen family [Verrucomicrobiae bacterium DG1235]